MTEQEVWRQDRKLRPGFQAFIQSTQQTQQTQATQRTLETQRTQQTRCLLTNPTPNPRLLTGFQEYLMPEIKVREVKAQCAVYNGEGKNPGDTIRIDEPKNGSSIINKL